MLEYTIHDGAFHVHQHTQLPLIKTSVLIILFDALSNIIYEYFFYQNSNHRVMKD